MKIDKVQKLILAQFLLTICLVIMDVYHVPAGIWKWGIFAGVFSIIVVLFFERSQYKKRLQELNVVLKRAMNGHPTRVLTNRDVLWNEVIFSINELIESYERVYAQSVQEQVARKQLFASMSHDIRTPLTSIIGYIDAIKDGVVASTEERQSYLEIVSKKSISLKKLIDEMFEIAKIDANEMSFQMEPLDLAELTREVLITFVPQINELQIVPHIDVPEQPCIIEGDYMSLLRMIENVVKNAVQYGYTGGVLGVTLREHKDVYELLIWDKGPGIQEEDLQRVFHRMYRGDAARTQANSGSGLGLSIAKALAQKHGGSIWVESIPWECTTFGIIIPKHDLRDF
jgi:signal transduction histidine kinase